MKFPVSIVICLISMLNTIEAQQWTLIPTSEIKQISQIDIVPNKFETYIIDNDNIRNILWSAPHERNININESETYLIVPLGRGISDRFKIIQYSMMEDGLANRFPDFKTFKGLSTTDPSRHIRIDHTLYGFRAVISDKNNTIYIDHYQRNDLNSRIVYNKKNFTSKGPWTCGVSNENIREQSNGQRSFVGDCIFREYRLALACTGEYAAYHGGTVPQVLSAYVTSINRVNMVYEYDLAVRLNLIANTDQIIYLDAATDPYTNGSGPTMLGQNQTTCDNVIGNANYDIGHVYSTGGGGVASLGSVCNNNNKARGVTGQSNPIGDPFDIDYVAHEMGHQFGGNHTFNNSCNNNRNNNTALEPGSGSTIMAYAGICSPNIQNNSDDYFHTISLAEIMSEMQSAGHTCEIDTITFNNAPPVVVPQGDYNIPISTYFSLELDASDPDGDPLEFLWDQMDNQIATMPPSSTSTGGPLFRSIKFTPSPIRYFPSIDHIINNTTNIWEVLPSVSRTLNFTGTAKDYHNIGGCNDEEEVEVTVIGTAGPFIVTSQNTASSWPIGSTQTITWDVANTDISPISAINVDILLSTDGGLTYSDTIVSNVPNDGNQAITVPNIPTTNGRIMVKASGNIFFDINNADIDIFIASPFFAITLTDDPFDVCASNTNGSTNIVVTGYGGYTGNVNLSIANNTSSATLSINPTSVPAGSSALLTATNFSALSGDYTMQVVGTDGSLTDTYDLTFSVVNTPNIPLNNTPNDGSTGTSVFPTFSWSSISDATEYKLEVSQDPSFASTVIDQTIINNNYTHPDPLTILTTYYWRVKAMNACGESTYSNPTSFTTETCITIVSTDVPKTISGSGTPTITSTLNFGQLMTITDLDLMDLTGNHTYISDLRFTLISPENTSVVLMDTPCGSQNDFDINFDDAAANSNWPCPPTDGLTYQPENPLSAFNGEEANGIWTLQIQDLFNQDGGSLNSWSVKVCGELPCTNIVTNINATGPGSIAEAISCTNDTVYFAASIGGQTIDMGTDIFTIGSDIAFKSLGSPVFIETASNQPLLNIDLGTNVYMEGVNLKTTSNGASTVSCNGNLTLKNSNVYKPTTATGNAFKLVRGANVYIEGTSEIIRY